MSAIDDLKEDRAEVVERLRDARDAKQSIVLEKVESAARYDSTIAQIDNQIDRLVNRRDRLTQAIRDLGDAWTPAP